MTPTDDSPGPGGIDLPETETDPRVVVLLKEYEEALKAGRRLNRRELLARHPDLTEELADGLDALDFVYAAAGQLHTPNLTPARAAAPESSPPKQLGDFRILRPIGRGGMGVVYEAVQESLGRHVALKVLSGAGGVGPVALERFRREAEAAARLHHTNIVPVFGVGEQDGIPFYAMQFIGGQGLNLGLHQGTANGPGPVPAEFYRRVARLGMQAAEGLDYAHRQGVLHRDVKPSNLLLDAHDTVWITDFGLAKLEGADELTSSGDVVGTLRYLAPERFRGQADARSDVYSLGLTLYELLTRRPAFEETDRVRLIEQVSQQAPPRLRQLDRRIPRDLETIVLKAIDREPARRYPTARDLADDLQRFLRDQPIKARPLGPLGRLAKWARRHPAVAGLLGALLLTLFVLLGLAGWSYWNIRQALGEKEQALSDKEGERLKAVTAGKEEAKARAAAEQETYRALFNETRLLRLAHEPGWRRLAWDNLHRLTRREMSPGGALALRNEAVACLCELDLTEVWKMDGHPKLHFVWSIDFSPDGLTVASASHDGVRLWDRQSGVRKGAFTGPEDRFASRGLVGAVPVPDVCFRPDGACLAQVGGMGNVLVRAWGDKGPTFEVKGTGPARSLSFGGGGRLLAIGWADRRVTVHDTNNGAQVHEITGVAMGEAPVALSPDGGHLATTTQGTMVQLYALGGAKPQLFPLGRFPATVRDLCFSPDGSLLAGVGGMTTKVWDVRARQERLGLQGHVGFIYCVAFSPDGQYLATGSEDGTARIWDTRGGQSLLVQRLPTGGGVSALAFSPDGSQLALGGTPLRLYQLDGRQERRRLPNHAAGVLSLAGTPEKPLALSGGRDGYVVLWDAAAGRALRRWPNHSSTAPVSHLALTPDGELATAGGSRDPNTGMYPVPVWETATGKVRTILPGHDQAITAVAIDPRGEQVAAGSQGGVTLVWKVAGEQVQRFQNLLPSQVRDVAFLRGGADLLIADNFGLQVRDLAGGQPRHVGLVQGGGWRMAVAPDESRVALTTNAGVRLLTLPELQTPAGEGLDRAVPGNGVAFSPDGRLLAVCGNDGQVTLRDGHTLQELVALPPETAKVYTCRFAGAGRYLLVGGEEPTVTVYDLHRLHQQLAELGLAWKLDG
jgi:eukaryotic-like serine/threonine-protein kinase